MTGRKVTTHTSFSPIAEGFHITVDESQLVGSSVPVPAYTAEPGRIQHVTERLLVDGDVMQMVLSELKSIRKAIEVLSRDSRPDTVVMEPESAPSTEPRQITDEQAIMEITEFITAHEGTAVFPDEVAEALDLDLMKVIEICEALVEEGKIARNV